MAPGLVRGRDAGRRALLTKDLRRDLKRGHPWLFKDAVRFDAGVEAGEVVTVMGKDGRAVATGYADPEGPLAVRACTTDPRVAVDDAWAAAGLERAIALRERLFAAGTGGATTGYRLVNGEGDGLPGLVVDRYDRTLVLKTDGPVAERFWDLDGLGPWLAERAGAAVVYARLRTRGGPEGRALVGAAPAAPVAFVEHGVAFTADVVSGQKTGFFFDQRENRRRVGALARDRRVLNAFGYTGGFSVWPVSAARAP